MCRTQRKTLLPIALTARTQFIQWRWGHSRIRTTHSKTLGLRSAAQACVGFPQSPGRFA